MRATLIFSAIISLVAADCMTYTGPPIPWSAGDVWTSLGDCKGGDSSPETTDSSDSGYTSDSSSGYTSDSYTTTVSPSTYTTVYSSGASTWTTIATGGGAGGAYPGHTGGYGSESPAAEATSTATVSYESGTSPATTTGVDSPAATFTGAAERNALGAGVVAVAGLALLL